MRFVFPARRFRGLAVQGFRVCSDTRKANEDAARYLIVARSGPVPLASALTEGRG